MELRVLVVMVLVAGSALLPGGPGWAAGLGSLDATAGTGGAVSTANIDIRSATARADPKPTRPNIVILMSDDQRWDMLTPSFTPNIYSRLVEGNPYAFTNAFVSNPLCCPSRASTLTGNYSHTTGVWNNSPPYGGFNSFHDRNTIAVDFDQAGYRTAMIGKYLNGYRSGTQTYVPPGWDEWFAITTGDYYGYAVTTNGQPRHFGSEPDDYSTRVLEAQAERFVESSVADQEPFFLYLSFTAPHVPAIPDPRDVNRFADVTPADIGTPQVMKGMLESAYGVDRAVGELLGILPASTVVIYMSDNGSMWGEHGETGKAGTYNEAIRVPIILKSLDGSYSPPVGASDLVLNVDLRPTLTRAAGIAPLTPTEGIDWGQDAYAPRAVFPLERTHDREDGVPTYCGAREADWMYTRFVDGTELLFHDAVDQFEQTNLDPAAYPDDYARLKQEAQDLCNPAPPGYSWIDGSSATALSINAPSSVHRGSRATITGALSSADPACVNAQQVTLVKVNTTIGPKLTAATGAYKFETRISKQPVVQVTYAGTDSCAPSESAKKTIRVT